MQNITRKLLLVGATFCFATTAQAQENDENQNDNHIAIGAGALLQRAPFNGAKTEAFPLPLISVKQGAFYFEAAETGVHFEEEFAGITPSIDLFVVARGTSGQDREKISADAGARISLSTKVGTLSGEFRHDITGKFKGSEVIARYSHPISTGRFTITPALQASWLGRRTANYMYGVTPAQRAKMIAKGRSVILPVAPITDDALNLGGDISMSVQLSERLILIGMLSGTYLDKSIHRSAAIDQKWESQAITGIAYKF
jgi:outer membrane scaffolding protein for murein synthesis (MipA/OmpV family)